MPVKILRIFYWNSSKIEKFTILFLLRINGQMPGIEVNASPKWWNIRKDSVNCQWFRKSHETRIFVGDICVLLEGDLLHFYFYSVASTEWYISPYYQTVVELTVYIYMHS